MITPEFDQWFISVCMNAKYVPDGAQRYDVAEFWVNALFAEINREAHVVDADPKFDGSGWGSSVGRAITNFKRKFGFK